MPEEVKRSVNARNWELFRADLTPIQRAADNWEAMGGSLRSRADSLAERGAALLGSEWSGDTRNSYEDFQRRLVSSLDEAADLAEEYGSRLRALSDLAYDTRDALSANLALIGDLPASCELGGELYDFTFRPEVADSFEALVAEAETLRFDFLSAQSLLHYGIRWFNVLRDWEGVGLGTTDPFLLPEAPPGTQLLEVDGEFIINTGSGNDQVQVTDDGSHILVTVNGVPVGGPPIPSFSKITIRGGMGNDNVEMAGEPAVTPTVLGGKGNDSIVANGFTPVVIGGKGDDVILGNYTGDYLSGGSGNDYIEGRDGGDVILAGSGGDTVYAGDGDDVISNPEGSSYLDTGAPEYTPDRDTVYSGDSEFRNDPDSFVSAETNDDVLGDGFVSNQHYSGGPIDTPFIDIDGPPEFVARVQADIDTLLRYTNEGPLAYSGSDLRLLDAYQNGDWRPGEHGITIRMAPPDADYIAKRETSTNPFGGDRDTVIHYNPVYNGPHVVTPAEGFQEAEYGSPVVHLLRELQAERDAWEG